MEHSYGQRLGQITPAQFQAALDRFQAGQFLKAEFIPFGVFGQNIFVTSSTGEYVLRGDPHWWWQSPTEHFYAQQLHERSGVPVPWPYHVDTTTDIFGWSYVLMPRMPGFQLADEEATSLLSLEDRLGIARTLGQTLARIQNTVTWPTCGHYDAAQQQVVPFQACNFPSEPNQSTSSTLEMAHSEFVLADLRRLLTQAHTEKPTNTTTADLAWIEDLLANAQSALAEPYEPCLLIGDYKEGNLVITKQPGGWQVSGLFDLLCVGFGDGEADLSRQIGIYLDKEPKLAAAFFETYRQNRPLRPGFAERFPIYMLSDRITLWTFFQRQNWRFWPEHWTLHDWASQYIAPPCILEQL